MNQHLEDSETHDPIDFRRLFEIEDRHFWFVARNHIIGGLLAQLSAGTQAPRSVVEMGCGTGNVLRAVKANCPNAMVVGMDLSLEGLVYARGRAGVALVEGDLQQLPLRAGVDLVCLFDVIEHISDDVRVLADVHELLAANGLLLITVPLHPSLWSGFDNLSQHFRRYTPDELTAKVLDAGFTIEYASPFLAATLPAIWLRRRVFGGGTGTARKRAYRELSLVPFVNRIMLWLLRLERGAVVRRRRLPFGSSMIVLARKS